MRIRWQFGIIAAIFVSVFCLYPQLKMAYLRGADWHGHYAFNDIDEVAYASYLRALIDGRPRKNDPYTGRDESPSTPQPESLFSIQFAAPYTIAIPARVLGIGTPWAMTLAGAFAGFFAALAAFWLIARMTGSNWLGMAGSLVVFAGGAVFAGEGAMLEVFVDGFSYPYFPGFRRYIPALAMTAVFVLFAALWEVLDRPDLSEDRLVTTDAPRWPRSTMIWAVVAVLAFGYTVFSYFYIWTSAAAFLGILFVLLLLFVPHGWPRSAIYLVGIGAGFLLFLAPYAYLLSKRSDTMEHVQLLVLTRQPDLWRFPEYIGAIAVLILIAGMIFGSIKLRENSTLFVLALALTPFAVFNQQVITGRSLQPIHYQVFIGNYIAGLALVLSLGLVARRWFEEQPIVARVLCGILAVAAIAWGFVECHYTVRVLDDANIERDAALPVARRLEELARGDADPYRTTVLSYDMMQADDLPSVAPQNVLWARHQHIFAGLSWQESKERYYQYLHYSNVDADTLKEILAKDFVSQIALFGWDRHSGRLSFDAKPLTFGEIADEAAAYGAYRDNFSRETSLSPRLSYVVVNNDVDMDLSVLDRWYQRDGGEVIGRYTIYRVEPR